MDFVWNILKTTRLNILNAVSELSVEQLNIIPSGFKNNIIWNIAHITATQQLLCYVLTEQKLLLNHDQIDENRKGTMPEKFYSEEEIIFWKNQLLDLANKLEKDYKAGLFSTFKEYPTSYNVVLTSIEEAIIFNNSHDALHFGYIMALKKSIL